MATTDNATGGDIYTTARLSPTSLRYYGLCLRRGSYRVRLHFAEIQYTDDTSFSALGRRIFDISIQVSNTIRIVYFDQIYSYKLTNIN